MQTTANYGLKKPDGTDVVNVQDFNDNAEVIDTALQNKVDKVAGKDLSTNDYTTAEKNKLAGVAAGANNYVHPSPHPPAIIAQDSNNRFVSDAEKSSWNAKAGTGVATTSANGLMSSTDKAKLDGVAAGANNYVHPSGDGNLHVPATGTTNNKKVLKAGTTAGSVAWGAVDYSEVTNTPDLSGFVTQEDLGEAGYGDMTKAIYDTDNDGKVNMAEAADAVPWSGVTGKPTTFPPAAHTHSAGDVSSGTMAAARLPAASTGAAGIVQLNNAVNSTSTTQAATANAVKTAYDLAAGKLGPGVTWNQLKGV